MLVAKCDGRIVGTAGLNRLPRRMSHRGDFSISVAKAYWNKGIGSRLLDEIIRFAKESDRPVIIGTERGVADTLIPACPGKTFYYLAKEKLICPDMKKITPELVRDVLLGKAGETLELPEELRLRAKKSIDAMLRLGE